MTIYKYNNAKTLFFISGMFAGGWMWRKSHPQITNSEHWVLQEPLCAIDRSVNSLSDYLLKEIRKIEKPITLIGNSLGSFVALDIAAKAPDKVDGVVISGSAGFGQVNLNIKLSPHRSEQISEHLFDCIFYDKAKITAPEKQKTADIFKNNFKNILGLIRESNAVKAEELLPKVQCPVRAIWGRDDMITPYETAETVCRKFDIPVSVIDRCGHSPMFEQPERFAEKVNNLI